MIIEVNKVSKKFIIRKNLIEALCHPFKTRTVLALDSVSFQIEKGESFAILGPNGAGKTTLIKILSTLILPDEGKVKLFGYDLKTHSEIIKSRIGLLTGEERNLYWCLTGRQNLEFFGTMYNLSKKQISDRINELNNILEIDDWDKPFETYSVGMKQRLALARCLISDPEVIFLDEPTKSLDPGSAHKVRNFIKETLVRKLKKTIFFATHQIDEATQLADRIAIISQGKIKACGKIEELQREWKVDKHTSLNDLYLKITG